MRVFSEPGEYMIRARLDNWDLRQNSALLMV